MSRGQITFRITVRKWILYPCLWLASLAVVLQMIDHDRALELVGRAAVASLKITVVKGWTGSLTA